MILCPLDDADPYGVLHPQFPAVLQFLRTDVMGLADGKHDIPSTDSYVMVASDMGRGRSQSPLEVHRRYIDIQLVLEGKESIGWSPLSACRLEKQPYCLERDLQFFADVPQTWLSIRPGQLAIFFPEDAHAPLAASGPVRKAVAKIPVLSAV